MVRTFLLHTNFVQLMQFAAFDLYDVKLGNGDMENQLFWIRPHLLHESYAALYYFVALLL